MAGQAYFAKYVSYGRAASTCFPASVIHTLVTSSALSSSTTVSLFAITKPLRTSSIKNVGRDVPKACKHRFSAAVGVRGDDLKRSATDAGDTLVTGALHSRCQLLANACMASHKATRGLDLAEPRPSSALAGVCAVHLVAGEAARHLELEVVALRHQVAVLRRQRSCRLRLLPADRLLWVWLYRIWPQALHAMNYCDEAARRPFVPPDAVAGTDQIRFAFRQDGAFAPLVGARMLRRTKVCSTTSRIDLSFGQFYQTCFVLDLSDWLEIDRCENTRRPRAGVLDFDKVVQARHIKQALKRKRGIETETKARNRKCRRLPQAQSGRA